MSLAQEETGLEGERCYEVCEIQSDFGLKAKANVAPDKGNPVRVDGNKRTLLPVENAKDTQSRNSLRTVICQQAEMDRPHE